MQPKSRAAIGLVKGVDYTRQKLKRKSSLQAAKCVFCLFLFTFAVCFISEITGSPTKPTIMWCAAWGVNYLNNYFKMLSLFMANLPL